MGVNEERIVEYVDRFYRNAIIEHLPVKDDDELLEEHKRAVERVIDAKKIDRAFRNGCCGCRTSSSTVQQDDIIRRIQAAAREAFLEVIDLNWKKCAELCRETFVEEEKKILSAEAEVRSENYWSQMKSLRDDCNTRMGPALGSKMQFIRLEHLDRRQNTDLDILMDDIKKQAIEGASEDHFRKEPKLRMIWGRAIIFWNYWTECRQETIAFMNDILKRFNDEEALAADETNPADVLLELKSGPSQNDFDQLTLKFAHVIKKDLSCYEALLTKLTEFLDLATSSEYIGAFSVEPKDLLFNIGSFQTNISSKPSDTGREFEICEIIIGRGKDGPEETAKFLDVRFHLKDLLKRLVGEGRLSQIDIIEGVINDLQEEETYMSSIFKQSKQSIMEISSLVKAEAQKLREDIDEWIPKRKESIWRMKDIIDRLNKTSKGVAITQTVASSVGIAGAGLTVGLLFSPLTFGTSLLVGGVVSGAGALTAIGANVAEVFIDKDEMERAESCILEDKRSFENVAKSMDKFSRSFTLLLKYIPLDELERLMSVLTDVQAPASNVDKLSRPVDGSVLMPVGRLLVASVVLVSKTALLSSFRGLFVVGAIFDIYSLFQSIEKLGQGAKSEKAEMLEKVVKKMEEEKSVLESIFDI